ncbi:MAG TPA: hypothetical protein VII97_14625 [Anaerolineales bacterium]
MIITADFFKNLPKVELHRHLEGSLRLSTIRDIARAHGITVPVGTGPLSNLVHVQRSEPYTYQNFLAKFNRLRMFYRSPEVCPLHPVPFTLHPAPFTLRVLRGDLRRVLRGDLRRG